jgi:hypothetical protein
MPTREDDNENEDESTPGPQSAARPFPAPAPAPDVDPKWANLSAEIAATIDREPGDRVRCTWISGNSYRCNWWAPGSKMDYDNPSMSGLTVTTHRVRKSEFLSVTKVGDGLVIRNRGARRSQTA